MIEPLNSEAITAALKLAPKYPSEAPFHPSEIFPEYALKKTGKENQVYRGVRELFRLLELDSENFGTPSWNPLGAVVRPGDKVVVKPNLLWHSHKYKPEEWDQIITNGSLIRVVVDYVLIALKGKGEVWITDGPQQDANFEQIVERNGLEEICAFFRSASSVPVHLLDLRDRWEDVRGEVEYGSKELPGDPAGGTVVNLAERSRFVGHGGAGRYYGACYDQAETNYHHSEGRHEYRISRTVASADVFINLPKMKTHKKVGVTLCLKNLVGINTGRNWLPHHTNGDPSNGGDQFPKPSIKNNSELWGVTALQNLTRRHPRVFAPLFRFAKTVAKPIFGKTSETIRSGNWRGNDTCWRMVQDINRVLMYSNGTTFPMAAPKRFFSIVDGIVGGDCDGPAAPDRFEAGMLLAGTNPVAVDCATTRLMGFDPMRIPMLKEAFADSDLPLAKFSYDDIRIVSEVPGWTGKLADIDPEACFNFRPHFGWVGQIEWGVGEITRTA